MLPVRTILHPTDFSDNADYAFRLAERIARDYQARIVILHVVTPIVMYGDGVMPVPDDNWQAELRRKLRERQPHDPKIKAEYLLLEGEPVTEIDRVAQEQNCDLIVMGTHGRTGLGRLLMGSVAEGVVRKAPCAVLTVKVPAAEGKKAKGAAPVQKKEALALSAN